MAKRAMGGSANGSEATDAAPAEPLPAAEVSSGDPDLTTKVATVGLIGLGVALIEASLIPGMIIGVAAALAPKYAPKLTESLRPLFKSTVRGAYKVAQKTREAVAEAGEQVQDLMAEARLEEKQEASASKANAEAPPAMKS
jgi:hypothetical protein